ncbi:microsomal signal peptidase subunit [Cristinia sonorae]|uniref:Signal peptidase complex subunit 1 n=1 Tax=Cristinia sonorae TaxID=1940300 RepID=A0A8K0XTF4_9AGAR|nr:microsomal signal peptidase subunit [Cristinia sonorae]
MSLADVKAYILEAVEGKIDFEGQKQAEYITRVALIAATILAFAVGFILQSLQVTFVILGVSSLALGLAVIPPWPVYNRHPVAFLPAKVEKDSKSQ